MLPWLGGCAGPGIPMSVRFMSAFGRALCEATASGDAELDAGFETGGGGGTFSEAGVRGELFLPRPSKISRSEPLLLSSDIRVS